MICTSCGTTNRDDAQFCRGCGNPLISPPQPPPRPPSSPLPPDPPPTSYPGYQSQYPPGHSNPLQNPGYGNYQAPMPAGASGRATASLILGIVSILVSPCTLFLPVSLLFSITSLILGKLEMNAIAQGQAPPAGLGYAKAGFWMGLIMTSLTCLGYILLLALGIAGNILQSMQQ